MSEPSRPWRIIVFTDYGGPVMEALRDRIRAKGHELAAVFTSPPYRSRAGARGYLEAVEAAASLGIPVVCSSKRRGWPGLMQAFEPDLAICAMFMWRIPEEAFTLPRLGMVNFHIGQLPEYRGTNSVGWAFRNDEGSLGVTSHWMAEGWDTGPVLARGFIPYDDDEFLPQLFPRVAATFFDVLDETLDAVAAGSPGEPQDESLARDCPIFEPEWRFIDWSNPSRMIHNQVRSWFGNRDQPRGAIGTVNGDSLIIHTTLLEPAASTPAGAEPGTLLSSDAGSIVVQCGDGPLRVIEWESAPE
jgi:methionyl-tRNA formyltransferase